MASAVSRISARTVNRHVRTIHLSSTSLGPSDDSLSYVRATDAKWNLGLSKEAQEDCAGFLGTLLQTVRAVPGMEQALPEVKYPRNQGYRPAPEENTHNAWYYKTDIRGASSGKLSGKRVAIKDNICVAGVPMMNGSRLMEGFIPKVDATVVTRILDAGGTIAGKSVCEDLCFSGNSFTSATGPVLNVDDVTRSSGGSSSGSASLVRNRDVDMAVGSDQGGSVRIPSSWSGLVGFKATFGLVPYTGAMGMSVQLDHLGPLTNNVHDCALLLEVMAGPDGMDPRQDLSITIPSYSQQLKAGVKGMKIGLLKEAFGSHVQSEVGQTVREAATKLQNAGASVQEVSLPHFDMASPLFGTIVFLGTYETIFKFGGQSPIAGGIQDPTIYDHITTNIKDQARHLSYSNLVCCMLGEALNDVERRRIFCHAQNAVQVVKNDVDKLLESYDVLLMPTLPMTAPKLPGEGISAKEQLRQMLMMTRHTEIFNQTHHPALTMPAGKVDGLSVGMMIVGKFYDEQTILNVAYTYEGLRDAK